MPDGSNLAPGMLRQDFTDSLFFSRIGDLWEQAEAEVVGDPRALTLQEAQQVARKVQETIRAEASQWGLEIAPDKRESAEVPKVFSLGQRDGTRYTIVLQPPDVVYPHVHPKKAKHHPKELMDDFQTVQYWLGRKLSGWWFTMSEKPGHPNSTEGRMEKLSHRLRTPNDSGDAHGGGIDESSGWVAFCAGTPGDVGEQTSPLEPATQSAMVRAFEKKGIQLNLQ